ncbi:MAG: hypothetical protein KDC57_16980 [Saprospiraceae bacterium]|nr:hypothetical protein [Saprospiraceae bacterium]
MQVRTSDKQLDSLVGLEWDTMHEEWHRVSKTEFKYNESGYNHQTLSYRWDTVAKQWILLGKDERHYNPYGLLSGNIFSSWDEASEQWKNLRQRIFTYDAKDQLLALIQELAELFTTQGFDNYFG